MEVAYKKIITTIILGGITCFTGTRAQTPPELVVGLSETADVLLTETLRKASTTGLRNRPDSLFEGVASVSRVVPRRSSSQKKPPSRGLNAYTLKVRDSTALRVMRSRWLRREGVEYAHPNYRFKVDSDAGVHATGRRAPLVNPLADSLDHLDVIEARAAWSATRGTTAVRIGVVDTGFYLNHPDLRDQFWTNEGEDLNDNGRLDSTDLNGVDDDGNGVVDDVIGYDFVDRSSPIQEGEFDTRDPDPSADPEGGGSGHGTAVAGVAAASVGERDRGINGVAPDARLVALRAFGGDGLGESDDIAAAIVYGATIGVDVLNLSFGRNQSVPVIREAIEYATDRGTIVVASAGNELTDDPHYPSDYPEVLSVVWLAEDGDGLPDFNRSQFGIGVDLGAPGTDVFTANFPADAVSNGADPEPDDLYRTFAGSSFSAPQVAGAAALLHSVDSTLSPGSIRSILTTTAEDLADENWDHTTGAGLLNVEQALMRAYPARTHIQQPAHDAGFHEQHDLPIVGTAVDPAFRHYSLSFAEGTRNLDERPNAWTVITPPTATQALRDTLGHWALSALEPGEYTLRLVTTLRDGRTIEDRRRVVIDRTPPSLRVEFLGSGRVEGEHGIVGDLATDDRTRLTTRIRLGGRTATVNSEQVARRHGVAWPDRSGFGGTAALQVTAENTSGLRTTVDTTLTIPRNRENTALLRRTETTVPRGVLLPAAPDFDGDDLHELVLNRSAEGGLTDSLRSYEWTGAGFARADSLTARLFPRDVGDTNRDGRQELLLQVRGGTLLLEQTDAAAFPDSLVFADSVDGETSLSDVANGTQLADLDEDGHGEILATSRRHVVGFERRADGFARAFRLSNPTSTAGRDSALANAFDTPMLDTGDYDGDGRRDLLAGDRDGDLVVYESRGDDEMEEVWTHETDRVDAGNRFASGSLTPNPGTEFVTMTTSFRGTLDNGEFAPPISHYSIWARAGDDDYERVYRLPVAGPYLDLGSMTTADLDADGLEEVVISHAPSLLVLDRTGEGAWRVLHEQRDGAPLQSRSLVAADFAETGTPSIVAETAGPRLERFVVDEQALATAPPRWTRARPTGASTVRLSWRAPGADSVVVYGGLPGEELNRIATVADSSFTVDTPRKQRYVLRAVKGEEQSPLSESRAVRPHAPAVLTEVRYPTATATRLRFTEPLRSGLRTEQFRLGPEERPPERVVQSNGSTAAVLHFSDAVAGRSARLSWIGVEDEDGLPVADTSTTVTFPAANRASLFIQETEIVSERRVQLVFNEPLSASDATERAHYQLRPRGQVAAVERDEDTPSAVTVKVRGLVVGPNGQESSLTVTGLRSTEGHRLSEEGSTVRLTRPAEDLSNVYVYPNPYRRTEQEGDLTIAGLPRTASIRVYTPDGRLVRVLRVEDNRNGGARWDLRDRRGEEVPSGIYLFRVNAPDQSPVLEKAAIIQ